MSGEGRREDEEAEESRSLSSESRTSAYATLPIYRYYRIPASPRALPPTLSHTHSHSFFLSPRASERAVEFGRPPLLAGSDPISLTRRQLLSDSLGVSSRWNPDAEERTGERASERATRSCTRGILRALRNCACSPWRVACSRAPSRVFLLIPLPLTLLSRMSAGVRVWVAGRAGTCNIADNQPRSWSLMRPRVHVCVP